ncbi:MAG TPA: DNA primase [Eubacterium sp.]|nr:DNA primase [Eubacterium sp.]
MFYGDDVINEVIEKNDIVDVVSSYVKLKKSGANYFGLCPFHNEKSPSFCVSPAKQMFYCFGCGEGGSVITFVMKYENYSFAEALKFLAEKAGMQLPEGEVSEESKRNADIRNKILEVNVLSARYYYHILVNGNDKSGLDYFKGRELSDDTIKKFGLGYTGKKSSLYQYVKSKGYSDDILKETGLFVFDEKGVYDKFWNRVMFPIFDVNNKVIAFGGRVLGDAKPKYVNSNETKVFNKSNNMYGLNLARTSRSDYMLICEGYMDVISLHQAGFNMAVAALGTSLTIGHANLVKRYAKKVILTFDSDEAGTKAALRAIPIFLNAGLSVKVLNMKPYKDPDEFIKNLGKEEFQKRIDEAENYFIFKIKQLEKNYDINTPDGKTDFYKEIANELSNFGEELERNNYIEAVSREFSIDRKQLSDLVTKMLYKPKKATSYDKEIDNRNKMVDEEDDAILTSQRLLLTWLIEEPVIYDKIIKYVNSTDFTDEFYKDVADKVFKQFAKGKVNPVLIINSYEDEQMHKKVARIFNSELNSELNDKEREKALNEIVINIKLNSIRNKQSTTTDLNEYQMLMNLEEEIKNINIKL